MKFIKSVFLSVLNSVLVYFLILVLTLSFFQRKFPPTLTDPRPMIEKIKMLMTTMTSMNSSTALSDPANSDQLIVKQQKMIDDLKSLQSAVMPDTTPKKDTRGGERDWINTKIRLDQADYKIKVLENEVFLLKNELHQLKPITK